VEFDAMILTIDAPRIDPSPRRTHRPRAWVTYLRYRVRLTLLYASFVSRPTTLELSGLVLGFVGAWALIAAVPGYLVRSGPPSVIALGLTVLGVVVHLTRKATISAIFELSAQSDRSVQRLRQIMAVGMRNESAYDILWQLYAPLVVEANEQMGSRPFRAVTNADTGKPALVVVLPATPADEFDQLLGLEVETPSVRQAGERWAAFAESRQQFMSALRRVDGFNNPMGDEAGDNVVLHSISQDESGSLRMLTGMATYGQIVRTSDSLINEFAVFSYIVGRSDALRGARDWSARFTLKAMPWRRAVHSWAGGAAPLLLRPTSRAAGIGVAVTMIPESRSEAYVARRSGKVGTYPDAVHVIPAGMCNAKESLRHQGASLRPDFLKWTMIGELLEECYDVTSLASYSTDDWVDDIRIELANLGLDEFEPRFSGLSIDLLNLRPEVCAVVPTQPRSMNRQRLHLCWEYSPHEQVRRLDLRAPSSESLASFVQSGVGALALAAAQLLDPPAPA
jgi:hypothetical protein